MKDSNFHKMIDDGVSAQLRIIATTDLHAHLYPYDYFLDKYDDKVGLIRAATLVKNFRRGVENSILVDGGDFLNGSPLSDHIAQDSDAQDDNPVVSVMNAMGYDAATVGNHEFNYGLDVLNKAIMQCGFPIISSNLTPVSKECHWDEYAILERDIVSDDGRHVALKIGLVGFAPPKILRWDNIHLSGKLKTENIVESARRIVPKVKKAGADIVIALAHTGIAETGNENETENAALLLAEIQGIDAIVSGHQHRVFPSDYFAKFASVDVQKGTINNIPTVMAGFCGSHIGVIDLKLIRVHKTWSVSGHMVSTPSIYKRDANNRIQPRVTNDYQATSAARKGHTRALKFSSRIVGEINQDIHSYFSLLGYDLSLQFVMEAQKKIVAQAVQGTSDSGLPIISVAAQFRCGGFGGPDYFSNINAGTVSLKEISNIYSFSDEICFLKLSGSMIKVWLERSAGIFNHIKVGQADQLLINPDMPSYYSDTFSDISYMIDPSQPARFNSDGHLVNKGHQRIVDLEFQGRSLRDDQEFVVALNDFRAFGGGNYTDIVGRPTAIRTRVSVRDGLIQHLNSLPGQVIPNKLNWRFSRLNETSAILESSPKSLKYLEKVPELGLTALSKSANGFQRYRLVFD